MKTDRGWADLSGNSHIGLLADKRDIEGGLDGRLTPLSLISRSYILDVNDLVEVCLQMLGVKTD